MTRKTSLLPQLAIATGLIGLIIWLEIKHPVTQFRVWTFLGASLLLANLAFALKGRGRDVAIALTALGVGLTLAEGVAIAMQQGGGLDITRGWSVRQPTMGWGPDKPGVYHAEMRAPKTNALIYKADYTIDSNLLRKTDSATNGPAIVFFGDSYTFGDGIQDNETLPQVFANSLNQKQRVLNLGFTGYGPQQFLREMETSRFDELIGPDPKLFIFLTAPWHAERTACKAYWTAHAPLYKVENGHVVFTGQCDEGGKLWLREWLQNSVAYRTLTEPYRHMVSRDDVELYVRILEAAVIMAKQKYGVATLIPYLRVPSDYLAASGFTNEAIMARLTAAGAIVLDASLKAEAAAGQVITIKGDGHPTPFANVRRAEMIKAYLEKNMAGVLLSNVD
ncbi:SGNH/GDSL hydrolase family protein [Methylocella silvestris]|uniref:SGNH hydrolase-type esterase domain-containing protein n=1 Tax=Methylocella silvestris TaxID=199596 RepID=A0A2J7TEA2_METSI|nr:SGNH/GDSL hydrolase family protein [Methylocella silvestris]PNG25094.1 hypothetical protein CR492_14880 [Methylocella silvestris]